MIQSRVTVNLIIFIPGLFLKNIAYKKYYGILYIYYRFFNIFVAIFFENKDPDLFAIKKYLSQNS